MPLTLEEIAFKLGVSASTVSRVVNKKKYVRKETRDKVLEAISKYGYVPNQVARSLKCRTSNTVAYIVPDISEDFFAYVYKGAESIFRAHGYNILMCDTDEDQEREAMYLDVIAQKQIAGVMLATVSGEGSPVLEHIRNGMKVVFFDNLPALCKTGAGPNGYGYYTVITDNIKASKMAVSHLAELGHRSIGIIAGKQEETTGEERLNGYIAEIRERNLDLRDDLIAIGDFKEKSGYQGMKRLLQKNRPGYGSGDRNGLNRITAVYVTSSRMTYGAIKAIYESGLKIPGDIALVGFDIKDPSGLIKPGITTLLQDE
ncbi:MAG: LacI family DNA-binding transcriptional regulator, partial [Eubacteriales bacterium]|nr:LacI family DNA-binding transcriptional regulator [Eubacteriales bacterium]